MRAIHFEQANKVFEKPESMTDEECYSISAYVGEVNGSPYINTVWQPNKEDIEAINAGRPVVMSMRAGFLVPHSLFTFDAEGKINE